jgi:succinoglycan biosynthesis protein ExoM
VTEETRGHALHPGPAPDWITVCVCTFKRPRLLAILLEALQRQVVDPTFGFDVVVVDNDEQRSSESVVRGFAQRASVELTYYCEPDRNISLARNLAVRSARGNLLAFIDDDELPGDNWLVQLLRTLKRCGAHGVLGPVIPDFPIAAPAWLKTGRVFHRRRFETGRHISTADARTGNVLLDRALFDGDELWFDPAFGRTGGEDTDFFVRQFQNGAVFVWCDEAVVHEAVPPERWKGSFHVKRLWRAGTGDGEWMRDGRLPAAPLLAKNVVILGACLLLMPITLLAPKHARMAVAQKMAYCGGLVTAYLGLSLYRERG